MVYRKQESKIWTKALTPNVATGFQVNHVFCVQLLSSYQLSTFHVCILSFPFSLRGVKSGSVILHSIACSRVSDLGGEKDTQFKLEF